MIAANAEQPQVRWGIYGGLFFTTLSTLMYEILLTRVFSVTMGYHYAFVAVSVALFGMTLGALLVHLFPDRFPQARTGERMFQAALWFSITIVVTFVTQLLIPFTVEWSLLGVYSIVFTYVLISVPFVFSGIAVCLALTRFPAQVSRLYAADLIGAGLGTVLLVWLLDFLGDGPSTVLAVAGLAAVGACLFAYEPVRLGRTALVAGLALALAVLGVGNAISAQNHHPILRVQWVKGKAEGVAMYETWNAFSRVRVFGYPDIQDAPTGWGMSPVYYRNVKPEPVPQLTLVIDSAAVTGLTYYNGNGRDIDFLRYDLTNMVHYVRDDADVFVIGSGGGRDVLSALLFNQRSVTAVELNDEILAVANRRFGEFTGHLDQRPNVTFVNDEARSYLTRSGRRYDIIQLSLIDTWAATAAGAFALSENSLYTVEAWEGFLEHLTDRGVLSATRWFPWGGDYGQPMEVYRLTSLAAAALRKVGVEEPRDHLILVRNRDNPFWPAVGTLLVSRQPFSPQDVADVHRVSLSMGFEVVLAPGWDGRDPVFARIAEAEDARDVEIGFPGDISPPTDDRPFFFQMLRFQDLFNPEVYGGFNDYLTRPVMVLFSLALTVLVLTGLCIVLPLLITTKREALRSTMPFIVFFSGIGLGFILLEISQMQRLIIFLGHPTYAFSVVLFSLLVASGIGSLATERLVQPSRRLASLWPLALLLAVLVVFGVLTPATIDRLEAQTTPLRIIAAVGILAPMGLVMGMPFPLGMKLASLRPGSPTAFFWGINGATSVCASVLAVAIALGWGISSAFWVGCFAYLTAAAALALTARRG